VGKWDLKEKIAFFRRKLSNEKDEIVQGYYKRQLKNLKKEVENQGGDQRV